MSITRRLERLEKLARPAAEPLVPQVYALHRILSTDPILEWATEILSEGRMIQDWPWVRSQNANRGLPPEVAGALASDDPEAVLTAIIEPRWPRACEAAGYIVGPDGNFYRAP
jgi:hypothetical protein